MLTRALFLVLAALLVAPLATASATSSPIAPLHARELRRAGWSVAWPAPQRLARVEAGETLRVTVAPIAGRRAGMGVVRIALVRLGTDGRPLRAVISRRLRRGAFVVTLPREHGARYALTAKVRGRMYRVPFSTLRSKEGDVIAPPPYEAPRPQTPPPPDPCMDWTGAPAATLSIDRTQVTNGDRLAVTISNSGWRCLTVGYPYAFERHGNDGGWTLVPTGEVFILPAILVPPGGSWLSAATIPAAATMPPGRYRIVKDARPEGETQMHPEGTLIVTAEFDVVPGPTG